VSDLFLLHAFPFDHRMWDQVAGDLAKAGWRVFTPDMRGFGRAPSWDGYEPDLKVVADDLVKLMDKFGIDKAVFGGCSLGGYVVMQMLRHYPERVSAVILVDTKASADSAEARANRLRVAESVTESQSAEAFTRAMQASIISPNASVAVQEQVASLLDDVSAMSVADMQMAMAKRFDSHEMIQKFRGSLLSIRGSEDLIATEADHEFMMDEALDGVHYEIAGAGHLPPIEKPVETSKAIQDFLNKLMNGSC
jgi:pimeloyl-ACP methyl ester carboxylesterase